MADTTMDRVLAIAPELEAVKAEAWELVLSDVAGQVGANWGQKQEVGQRYLAAHRLTLILRNEKGAAVTAERTGDVSTNYAAPGVDDYSETVYGREFQRLRRGTIAGFMTVTP